MGIYLRRQLLSLLQRHRTIGDVPGMGLMVGVEFVGDCSTREQAPTLRDAFVHRCFESGLLLLGCGPSAIRVIPPINVTKEEIDAGIAIMDQVLREMEVFPLPVGEG